MCVLLSKYWCYGGYSGWIVLDMINLSFDLIPALNPHFICNGMTTDSATASVICTSLGQSTSWCVSRQKLRAFELLTLVRARRSQLVSLPASELGNTSASPRVIVDDIASACSFGTNEQARDLEYDSASSMVYISTQQCVNPRTSKLHSSTICSPSAPLPLTVCCTRRYDDSRPFDLGHAAYALGPLAGARAAAAPPCIRLTYFTGDYDMVAQASVAIAQH